MTTKRRTYDANTVDAWLAVHLQALEDHAQLLQSNIEAETSLRLRTIAKSKLLEVQHQIVELDQLITRIKELSQHGATGIDLEVQR
ncbi:hypothetical protein ACT3TB_11075 [Micrococcaceae sp. AOP34-BR2-30]